jgi:hypothetical protein
VRLNTTGLAACSAGRGCVAAIWSDGARVVHHAHPALLALHVESPRHAAERGQRFADVREAHLELETHHATAASAFSTL